MACRNFGYSKIVCDSNRAKGNDSSSGLLIVHKQEKRNDSSYLKFSKIFLINGAYVFYLFAILYVEYNISLNSKNGVGRIYRRE